MRNSRIQQLQCQLAPFTRYTPMLSNRDRWSAVNILTVLRRRKWHLALPAYCHCLRTWYTETLYIVFRFYTYSMQASQRLHTADVGIATIRLSEGGKGRDSSSENLSTCSSTAQATGSTLQQSRFEGKEKLWNRIRVHCKRKCVILTLCVCCIAESETNKLRN